MDDPALAALLVSTASTATAHAANAAARALKASGSIVKLEPAEFSRILSMTEEPLIVISPSGFRKRKHRNLPSERLGLEDQMTLLAIAGESVAKIYGSLKRRKGNADSLMEIRNRSILAHGTNPVTEKHWIEFRDKTEVVIKETVGKERFKELLAMATHGEIHIV